MYLVQILLPCVDNGGRPFAQEDFESVKRELTLVSTASPPTCRLLPTVCGGDEPNADKIVIFEVMTERSTYSSGVIAVCT